MRWRSTMMILGTSLALACGGGKDGMGGSDSEGSGSGEGGDGDCRLDDFGTVMIELNRSAAEQSDPFVGTAKISVFLDYEACLADFYVAAHTEYQQDGVEGAVVFGDWGESCLCDGAYARPSIDCSVPQMQQVINTQGAMATARLMIEYEVASDAIEGLIIPFGPLPTESLAGCTPLVRLSGSSVQGLDANGMLIWQIASYDNAVARVNQGAPIQIFVERSG